MTYELEQSLDAQQRIKDYTSQTHLIYSNVLSEITKRNIFLKPEIFQPTGSFKVRPAFNGILHHLDEARKRGVLTTSSGNFAQGVAYAARALDVKATIVMTDDTSPFKIRRTEALGARVVFCGKTFESRFHKLEEIQATENRVLLHGFDSEDTIFGNATIGLELMADVDGPFTVICPASGGGLISGISCILKNERATCEIIGVQPEAGGAIVRSLKANKRVNVGKIRTIADALVASIPGERTFDYIKRHVDGFHLVSEGGIKDAMQILRVEQKLMVEGGGATSVAGLLSNVFQIQHNTVICVLSGGNTKE